MIKIETEDNINIMFVNNSDVEKIQEKIKDENPFIEYLDEKLKDYNNSIEGIEELGKISFNKNSETNNIINITSVIPYTDIEEVVNKYNPNKDGGKIFILFLKLIYYDYMVENEIMAYANILLNY